MEDSSDVSYPLDQPTLQSTQPTRQLTPQPTLQPTQSTHQLAQPSTSLLAASANKPSDIAKLMYNYSMFMNSIGSNAIAKLKKCVMCNINWHEIHYIKQHSICVACSNQYRCKMCNLLLYPNLTSVSCNDCWDKLGISKILDGLYLSDYVQANNYEKLKELGIKQILSIGCELTPHETDDFNKLHISLDDHKNENISQYFSIATDFINKGPTLVHCYAGISRSASLVIAYLIKMKKWSIEKALSHCRKVRPVVNPNAGFMHQLREYYLNIRYPIGLPNDLEDGETSDQLASERYYIPNYSINARESKSMQISNELPQYRPSDLHTEVDRNEDRNIGDEADGGAGSQVDGGAGDAADDAVGRQVGEKNTRTVIFDESDSE